MSEHELFDGHVLEFPEGTDPAVIQSTNSVTMERLAARPRVAPAARVARSCVGKCGSMRTLATSDLLRYSERLLKLINLATLIKVC
jgi:hypothetical protein